MTFPSLSTGSVTQYNLPMGLSFPVEIVRFVDGSDQRFPLRGRMLRRWHINLQLLNEGELSQVERFFATTEGEYSTFDFPDPISGETVANCRFASPQLETDYLGTDVGTTALWVIETNG